MERGSPLLTLKDADVLAAYSTEGTVPLVVALCAAWCDTCGEFRTTFERIAQTRPQMLFLWLAIGGANEGLGATDIKTFPHSGDTGAPSYCITACRCRKRARLRGLSTRSPNASNPTAPRRRQCAICRSGSRLPAKHRSLG